MTQAELDALMIERKGHYEKAQAIIKRSRDEGRDMTQDEARQFDAHFDDFTAADQRYKDAKAESEKALSRRSAFEKAEAEMRQSQGRKIAPTQPHGFGQREITYRGRRLMQTAEQMRRNTDEYRADFNKYLGDFGGKQQYGALLQTDVAEKGGYLAPGEMVAEILKTIDNTFWMRRIANVLPPTSAPSITWPKRNGRIGSFGWGTEVSAPSIDTALKVGQRSLTPHYMTGEIDVSNDLLMSAVVDIDQFVVSEIGYASGNLEEQAFFTGSGNGQPVGLFTVHANGLTTDNDTSGSITTDYLIQTKYALREPYLADPSLRWVGSRQFFRDCASLKDTANGPVWLVSFREGMPDTLLGTPTVMSEYAPTGSNAGAWASGDYQAIIGAFRHLDILDGVDMGIQRDESLLRRSNQTAYIVRRKVDACVRYAEAFRRLKKS